MNPIQIRDINVYPFYDMQQLISHIENKKVMLFSVNAEILMKASKNVSDIMNRHIAYADGFGAVKALEQKGCMNVHRIPGCELWLRLIEQNQAKNKSFYLIGATEDVIQRTVFKLKDTYPLIKIVGYRNGYINTETERQDIKNDIMHTRPDFIFIAMGFPEQELLMNELYTCHPAVYLNLGGSFDVFIHKVSRAPKWMQKLGMEWFYRFITHPSRYKRQIVYLYFLWAYFRRKL